MSPIISLIAHPVETILREPETVAIERIRKLCSENNIKVIVAGLPKNMNNTIGEQAQDCIDFANNFNDICEIVFEDERLTSRQAEYILAQTGRKYTKDKKLVDLKSACIILQQYLDRKWVFMKNENEELIETVDEEGNKVTFELLDVVTVEDVEYALLLPNDVKDDEEEGEILVMRLKKDGEEYSFEAIEDDEEFNKVAEYIEELEDEIED